MKPNYIGLSLAAMMLAGCGAKATLPDLAKTKLSAYTVETVADGLKAPWAVAVLPDGGYLVTEKLAGMKRVDANGTVREMSGLPEDIYIAGQGGWLDVELAPDFENSQAVYLSYSYGDRGVNGTGLYKAKLGADGLTLENGETIYRSSLRDTSNHYGGRIAFLPDNTLVLTLGDGFAYREKAQDISTTIGKTVRLNMDGSVPEDNPFVNEAGANPAVYTLGNRNVQGAHYDAETGTLWAHEHGPKGGDELNILIPGGNYGWPLATTGVDYNGAMITPNKTKPGTQAYVTHWTPSIAPSGLTIYRGDMFSDWKGDALVGSLKFNQVHRVDLDGGKKIGEDIVFSDVGERVRDVVTAPDGAILIVTDSKSNGKILRVTP